MSAPTSLLLVPPGCTPSCSVLCAAVVGAGFPTYVQGMAGDGYPKTFGILMSVYLNFDVSE